MNTVAVTADERAADSRWQSVRVEDVALSIFDGPFGSHLKSDDYSTEGCIVVRLENIGTLKFFSDKKTYVPEEKFSQLRRHTLLGGDVLVSSFLSDGVRVCRLPEELSGRAINKADCFCIRVDPQKCWPQFLMYRLACGATFHDLWEEVHGATRPRINLKQLRTYRFELPPLAEQKRIADKLDALRARVDACRERLDRVPGILKRFRQAVLSAAVGGDLTSDWRRRHKRSLNGWTTVTVADLVSRIEAGLNVQCVERPPAEGERGLVKISAVTWGEYDDEQSKTLPRSAAVPESARIRVGDFLISRANTLELVGACVVVRQVRRPVYLSDKILRLCMEEQVKSWLLCVLQSVYGRQQIESLASGNQLSMRNLSQANLRQILVPMPPDDERDEIVKRARGLLAHSAAIEARRACGCAAAAQLTPALLAKAFRGDLAGSGQVDECVAGEPEGVEISA